MASIWEELVWMVTECGEAGGGQQTYPGVDPYERIAEEGYVHCREMNLIEKLWAFVNESLPGGSH